MTQSQDARDEFQRLRAAILAGIEAPGLGDAAFNELALEVFRFQRKFNPFYSRFCDLCLHKEVTSWEEIPAVPTTAFKRTAIRSFPAEETITYFQTSGTTEGESGRHYFSTLELYEAAIIPNFRAHLLPDLEEDAQIPVFMLTPSPAEAPHSSLVHMMEVVSRRWGTPQSAYFIRQGALDTDGLLKALERCIQANTPVLLLGTAFSYVFLLEEVSARNGKAPALPAGSRLMETGGFKGRTRELPRPEFYRQLSEFFGVPPAFIVNEYGMTELSSQFYDVSLRSGCASADKALPHWTRVVAVNPATGKRVAEGERGLLRILDLANLGSVMALQTEDVGVCRGNGFEVLGRVASAPPRGCSLAAEALLSRR